MMPQLVTVRVRRPDHRTIRVWVPTLPVALVLSPIVALAVVALAAACLANHVNVVRTFRAGWRVVSALPGTRVDFEQGQKAVLISIR